MEQNEFGPHLTLDAKGCDLNKLTNLDFIYHFLNDFPDVIKMEKMSLPQTVPWKDEWAKTPGVSGFVMITTSHISIHTFPDDDYAFFDVFSCKTFDVEKAIEHIKKEFNAKEVTTNVVKRGLDFRKPGNLVNSNNESKIESNTE